MSRQEVAENRREDDDLRALIRETVDTAVAEPFGAYVFTADEPGARIGRLLEQSVFLKAYGNTAEQLEVEYGAYESSSLFFCVIDHRRQAIAGMMRVIVPTSHGPGLKSLQDIEPVWGRPAASLLAATGLDLLPDQTWDCATLAVADDYRSPAALGLVNLGLFQSFVRTARRVGVDSFVTILDHVAYRMLRLRARFPFIAFGEGRPYLGSRSSIPAFFSLMDWRERLDRIDRELRGVIFDGRGIELALRPIDLESAVACVRRCTSGAG